MSGITLTEVDDATIPTPAAGKATLFMDNAVGPAYKDDTGAVTPLEGPEGPPGQGVPAGGTAGQVLAKVDGTDYNTEWADPAEVVDRSTVTAVSSASGVVTLNYALGDYFTLTLTENVTSWVISNPPGSGKGFSLMVQITQDSTPRTVAKPGTTAGGTALDVSTASGAIDLLAITSFNNGTTLRSTIAKAFS